MAASRVKRNVPDRKRLMQLEMRDVFHEYLNGKEL